MGIKKLLLGLIGIVLFSLKGNAQAKEIEFIYGSVITTFNQEIIEYKFKSLEELNEGVDQIANEFNFEDSQKERTCEIKIEIRIELSSEATKILISETANTICNRESLSATANRLKSIALATKI